MASLYPESHLSFSPQLAESIGVEEAILLQVLCDCTRLIDAETQGGQHWFELKLEQLSSLTPFWNASDLWRVIENLRDKGLILVGSAPLTSSHLLRFALQESIAEQSQPKVSVQATRRHPDQSARANRIAPNWQPDENTLKQLAQQGVPREFALQHCGEFVQYWRERDEPRHAWGNKFIQRVMQLWRQHEIHQARLSSVDKLDFAISNPESAMTGYWRPSEDAMNLLINQAGINRNFVEDSIPEFVLFWKEKQEISNTWNSRFIKHIKRQWASYQHTLQNDVEPRPIAEGWTPSQDVYEVLRLANIDLVFARSLLPEFVIFWRDRNELKPSWNTTFLQFVKSQWSQSQEMATGKNLATRDRSLEQDLTDRSWAE